MSSWPQFRLPVLPWAILHRTLDVSEDMRPEGDDNIATLPMLAVAWNESITLVNTY